MRHRGLFSFAKSFVDARLKPGAKPGTDIMQAHINNGLTRDELVQDVFSIVYVWPRLPVTREDILV